MFRTNYKQDMHSQQSLTLQGANACMHAPRPILAGRLRRCLKASVEYQGAQLRQVYANGRPMSPAPAPKLPIPNFVSAPQQQTAAVEGAKATGKTVVITGGSQGVGRATALLFARKGYNVVVAARDATRLQYVADDCAQAAGRQGAGLGIVCDVTDEQQVKDLVHTVLARFETVNVVINNAGIMARGAFVDTPVQEADKLMRVNFLGAYMVTQHFLPILTKEAQRAGGSKPSVIMVNSFAGKVPLKYMSAFTASKFALMGFTESVRAEVAPLGIHVGQVHPGVVKSNHLERTTFYGKDSEEERNSFRQAVRALPISQTPQQVADAIYSAVAGKKNDVMVGMPFQAVAEAYRLSGLNPLAVPLPFM